MDDMATEFKNVTVTGFAWANPHALVFFDVKDDNVEAKFTNGVLTVRVPKPAELQHSVRRIEVKSH